MEKPNFRWALVSAALIGCSSSAEPDDVGTGGGGTVATTQGGSVTGAAGGGSGSTSAGGSGTPTVGSPGTAGQVTAGGSAAAGGPTTAGSPSAGAGGLFTGSAGTGGVGGATVDPSQLPSVTLHLAGDSTVMTYEAGSAQEGWGQELPPYFVSKLSFDNQALGGSSVQSFYTGRWQTILGKLHAGDYVMAAFGANDSGFVDDRHVEPPAFQAQFAKMADDVEAKQATFIAVTPSALQQWSGGMEGNERLGPYVSVLHAFATEKNVPLDDLNARSLDLLNQIGQEAAKEIYINGDKAHFTKKGATQMAAFVAHELQRIGSPLGAYVN